MTVLDKSENCVLKESGGFTPSVLAENIRNLVEGGCNNEAVDSQNLKHGDIHHIINRMCYRGVEETPLYYVE